MASFERSQRLNMPLSTVWQTVGNVSRWPDVFDELVRIQADNSAGSGSESSSRFIGTDTHARSFAMTVSVAESEGTRTITAVIADESSHPRGIQRLMWVANEHDDQTLLTLKAEFSKPVPLIGTLIARARRRGDAESSLHRTFDEAVRVLNEQLWNYQDTVQTILARKGRTIISALPGDSVESVCALIRKHRIGAVLIRTEDGSLVGLVSERDIVYELAHRGATALQQSAADIMTRDLIVCEPQRDLLFVMACMSDNKIRHLPVIDQGQLVGVISIGDVVQQRMHALEAKSDALRNYIAAREWRFHSPHRMPTAEPAPTRSDEPVL